MSLAVIKYLVNFEFIVVIDGDWVWWRSVRGAVWQHISFLSQFWVLKGDPPIEYAPPFQTPVTNSLFQHPLSPNADESFLDLMDLDDLPTPPPISYF